MRVHQRVAGVLLGAALLLTPLAATETRAEDRPADSSATTTDKAFTDADVRSCVEADKVFVIVDPMDTAPKGGCASKFSTGYEALVSAGFEPDSDSFITTIDGIRADYTKDSKWWTYWHRSFEPADGKWAAWEFSEQGLGTYQPKPGTVEGWSISPASGGSKTPRWAGYELDPVQPDDSAFAAIMPDVNYRRCVTDKLGLPVGAVPTSEQLAGITSLSCTGRGIKDATGTSALTGLTKLFLGNNSLTSLEPLAQSDKLFSLGIQNNQITDISPLRNLMKLRSVTMNNNKVGDISVLGQLPELDRVSSGSRQAQAVDGAPQHSGVPVPAPTLVGFGGWLVQTEPPAGVTVSAGKVTYPGPGTYVWKFRDEKDFGFNGTVTVEVTAPSVVTIPDDAFRACINSRLKIDASEQPTAEQLAGLTGVLRCTGKGVKDLQGAHLLTGLTGLRLYNNDITDLSPLRTLTELTVLEVGENNITTLAPLGAKPKLRNLSVQRTSTSTKAQLVSLAGIEQFRVLTSVVANNQGLTSLDALAGLKSLVSVEATGNALTDVAFASELPSLDTLKLDDNHIADLGAFAGRSFKRLSVLNQTLTAPTVKAGEAVSVPSVVNTDGAPLAALPPVDIETNDGQVTYSNEGSYTWSFDNKKSPLPTTFSGTIVQRVDPAPAPIVDAGITDDALRACINDKLTQEPKAPISREQLAGLTELTCVGKGIKDLTGAQHLTDVTKLTLSTNEITDLSPLAKLKDLRELNLPGNQVSDLKPLQELVGLEVLNISQNPVESIADLKPLTGLKDLAVGQRQKGKGYPGITSLDGVQQMQKLEKLQFNNSRVSDLTPLENLSQLRQLFFHFNQAADLQPLAKLTQLEKLGADSNGIADLSPLAQLSKLTSVGVNSNHISDLSPLDQHSSLQVRARWQKVEGPVVEAGTSVPLPRVVGLAGGASVPLPRAVGLAAGAVQLKAPDGVQQDGDSVTYPSEGRYVWTWSEKLGDDPYFDGEYTQPVSSKPEPEPAPEPEPTEEPAPTEEPTVEPTADPTPSDEATEEPTAKPTPTDEATAEPTPTVQPTTPASSGSSSARPRPGLPSTGVSWTVQALGLHWLRAV